MNIITKQIELIKRVDQLIRLQATGNPTELSNRLGISKTKLYRIIHLMRDFNAPIIYDDSVQSFVYAEEVGFRFGFYNRETLRV
ncbi:hypothetical protein U6A24_18200 [Aquimarina gracilis]|uniref:HTH domain-containing protein n=1 Tax=Aquimarina gracilis TaxID=874422 RepID=A0ABU5ZZW2_9FLAO|nr:hypothetical protein [Aquimarina gracilis]MEB3347413.1 hypothetical protein [Aquimarina gracilis]